MGSVNMEKKWVFPLAISSLVCVFLLATSLNMGLVSSLHTMNSLLSIFPLRGMANQSKIYFAEDKLKQSTPPPSPGIPRFAYLISGSRGDLEKLWRTLQSLYHPLNHYVLHLDLESPAEERLELASRVDKEPMFAKVGNVFMITKANMVTYRGPTMVANTLHACAILLKRTKEWDWFINLSASDYPLVTQDDLLSTFAGLNRDLNFIEHTSDLGWKEGQRAMPLIIDPGLYQTTKSDIFWVTPRRALPTAFKLFTGSAWMILSRSFVEYLIWGWDNLPRTNSSSPFTPPLHNQTYTYKYLHLYIIMSDISSKISGHRRLSSRLQKRAPASIKISPAPEWNVAIPLLSPLDGSPPSLPIRTLETKESRNSARKINEPEKAPAPVVYKKWQHPAAPFCHNESAPIRPFMFCTAVSDRS